MRILGIDTSGKVAAAALYDSESRCLLAQQTVYTKRTHSQVILPLAERLLADTGLNWQDVDGFAAAKGPGSYTGLRIGIAAVKAMSYALQIPCVGISTLEGLAWQNLSWQGVICAVMTARQSLVYAGLYQSDGTQITAMQPDGMQPAAELAQQLADGVPIREITGIRGTCYLTEPENTPWGGVQCPDYAQVCRDKKAYAKATRQQYDQQDEITGKTVLQRHGSQMLVQNPPALSLTQDELDAVYRLPYQRRPHPMYDSRGGVPGIEEVQFSIAHNRGCFGYCNFCSIALHQGRRITCRSEESILEEAKKITEMPNFKGYIHDVGGPTANFRLPSCKKQAKAGMCPGKKCLAPEPCKALQVDHSEYLGILRKLRKLPRVKRVFIRSGIRFDYVMADKDDTFFKELVAEHVSGQLKVAPEHVSNVVLDKMGKPHIECYEAFQKRFYEITKSIGKKQYLVPYLMSSHPGSTLQEAVKLSLFLRDNGIHPEQVQDFYPTPGTISTCMYYTELDPYTMEPVYVPKTPKEKAMQRALLQYYLPQNRQLVLSALKQAGRQDLIGTKPGCLVAPEQHAGNSPKPSGNGQRHPKGGASPRNRKPSSKKSRRH